MRIFAHTIRHLTGVMLGCSLLIGTAQAASSEHTGTELMARQQQPSGQANTADAFVKKMLAQGAKPNRLINEKSPYLLLHAFNPVDWYPWGEEAFEKARKENKPIFLSIGYSTCHWCHVMARESFDNPEIAEIMNAYFINIKVDREERPDVDRIYIAATQAATGSAGWPLSVFMTPDLKPFYMGTYYPPESKFGRPGFKQILQAIHDAWSNRREQVLQSADKIIDVIRQDHSEMAGEFTATDSLFIRVYDHLAREYDERLGGFGPAPKFPRPVNFTFLFRYYHRTGEPKALSMALTSLRKMAQGGVYDQIGGGFHRYAVDARWHVPHFEKMLYDQAQLAVSYLEAYQLSGEKYFADIARDIFAYVLRDMRHPEGPFYSAEDAESPKPENPAEKGEGAFYIWTQAEIEKLLGADAELALWYYGCKPGGNVAAVNDPQEEFHGKNILFSAHTLEETAHHFKTTVPAIEKRLARIRAALKQARDQRPRPHLDDKVLTSWNGLMISALARGFQVLQEPELLQAAEQAADFLLRTMVDPKDGSLKRRYRDGEAGLEAELTDYAYFVQGLIDLYETSQRVEYLRAAAQLTEKKISLFADREAGGFFDTSGADASILVRTKESHDGAEPSGNSVAAMNLLRLAQMVDKAEWYDLATGTFSAFAEPLQNWPQAMPNMLAAVDYQLQKPKQIIIAGDMQSQDTRRMLREVFSRYLPNKIVMVAQGGEKQKNLATLQPFVENISMRDGKATAYICEDFVCSLPTSEIPVMIKLLEK